MQELFSSTDLKIEMKLGLFAGRLLDLHERRRKKKRKNTNTKLWAAVAETDCEYDELPTHAS